MTNTIHNINNKCVQSAEFWQHVFTFDSSATTLDQIPECNICQIVCVGILEFLEKKGNKIPAKTCDVNTETFAAHCCARDLQHGWYLDQSKSSASGQWLGCVHCKTSHHVDNYRECGTCFMQASDTRQDPQSGYVFLTCAGCGKQQIWD